MEVKPVSYETRGGIVVSRETELLPADTGIDSLVERLDAECGVLLASHYEYPGRYSRWDVGFVNPPIRITGRGRQLEIASCNERGEVLLPALAEQVRRLECAEQVESHDRALRVAIAPPRERLPEEQRSRQPTVFAVLRGLIDLFRCEEDLHLGLYGAFGYDLALQFEPLEQRLPRAPDQRDLVLYLPDDITVVDNDRNVAQRYQYEFEVDGASTRGLRRTGPVRRYVGGSEAPPRRDHQPGEFADLVRKAHEWFRRGDLFEVVPGQAFFESCRAAPSEVFRRLRERNPAPFAALMNLGEDEYLVSASPEMYVRVDGRRVESCPISGTVARGADALGDADQVLQLLNSAKDDAELTMCTDVDRNDKSRICEPGSVRILGRRQIEMYSKVIHTVDHVEGTLREGFDAVDAFLTHVWAVTVTGAPKLWAMRFIEQHERSPRGWYGGAIGYCGFNGNLNTGLTLRTVRIKNGVAEVRAGGTLLIDSDPEEEERETEMKAAAFLDAIRRPQAPAEAADVPERGQRPGVGRRVLLLDYEDSFVHTLANYVRQAGADVSTLRATGGRREIEDAVEGYRPDLVFLSPGPGSPRDFGIGEAIAAALERDLPIFGVCLGLQAIVEHFGGELGLMDRPVHGRASAIQVLGGGVFEGLPEVFSGGRYHSLYAVREALPDCLRVTAETSDGVVMGIEHRELPLAAVQFHPESLMTLKDDVGLRLMENVVRRMTQQAGLEADPVG